MNLRALLATFGPLAAAVLVFAVQPRTTAIGFAARTREPMSLELPMPSRAAEVLPGTYDLVPERCRFVLSARSFSGTIRARTDDVAGWLRQGEDAPDALELELDLRKLVPVATDGSESAAEAKSAMESELYRVLGFAMHERLRFAGRAVMATAVPDLPLQRVDWSGRVEAGGRGRSLSMQLWHVALGNGRIHAQGTVTVDSGALELPHRYFLGLLPDPVSVTLGFDLEFAARL
ncbi:MAG: hypothetical protein ABL997_04545 [Planctomycetota bacterium]